MTGEPPVRKYAINKNVAPIIPDGVEFGVHLKEACREIKGFLGPFLGLFLSSLLYSALSHEAASAARTHQRKRLGCECIEFADLGQLALLPDLALLRGLLHSLDSML